MRAVLAAGLILLGLGALSSDVLATTPITGKILLRREGGPHPDVLSFTSRDPRISLPEPGSPDAPDVAGIRLDVVSQQQGSQTVIIPGGWWRSSRPGSHSRWYRFKSIPLRAVIREGQFRLRTEPDGISLKHRQGAVGVLLTMGSRTWCVWFDGDAVRDDRPGFFRGKSTTADSSCGPLATTTTTNVPGPSTTSTTLQTGGCGGESTFQIIQERVFAARGCTTSTCHGAFDTSGLDLRPGSSHVSLVDVPASNDVAAAAGKKRVVPGDPAASFLSQKLHGELAAGEGASMPSVGRPLDAAELALVDEWIAAGAPQVGEVPRAPCLPPEEYAPADPLSPPAGGYQLVLTGPVLQPGQEQEGCLWVPTPNSVDFFTGKWEFALNPGTHHFAVFEWNKAFPPVTGVWNVSDFGCFSGSEFGNNISGSPQAPYYVDAYPSGVARLLRAGRYLGLNAHYYNEFDVPIQVKVWINIHPYEGPTPKVAQTIIDIDDTFGISIPPYTVQLFPSSGSPRARWTNGSGKTWSVINLGGHMHHRGLRFTAWAQDGTKLYENFDWAHPDARYFTPTLDLPPGGYVDYECLYDNGVDRPVRTDAYGNPTTLVFGVSAEDAMCILTGQYYPN